MQSDFDPQNRPFEFGLKEIIGIGLIAAALYIAYWIGVSVMQIWNNPETVGLLNFIYQTSDDFNLGAAWPMIPNEVMGMIAVIISLSVFSVLVQLVRTLMIAGLSIMFPEARTNGGLIELLRNKGNGSD